MAIGIERKKELQVGATPRCTFDFRISGENTSTNPSRTSSTCVAKSATARKMLTFADSWIPTMFRSTSSTITTIPKTTSHGFCRNGAQKTER
jgi:hypothetical protein